VYKYAARKPSDVSRRPVPRPRLESHLLATTHRGSLGERRVALETSRHRRRVETKETGRVRRELEEMVGRIRGEKEQRGRGTRVRLSVVRLFAPAEDDAGAELFGRSSREDVGREGSRAQDDDRGDGDPNDDGEIDARAD